MSFASRAYRGKACPNNCGLVSHARTSIGRSSAIRQHLPRCPKRNNIVKEMV